MSPGPSAAGVPRMPQLCRAHGMHNHNRQVPRIPTPQLQCLLPQPALLPKPIPPAPTRGLFPRSLPPARNADTRRYPHLTSMLPLPISRHGGWFACLSAGVSFTNPAVATAPATAPTASPVETPGPCPAPLHQALTTAPCHRHPPTAPAAILISPRACYCPYPCVCPSPGPSNASMLKPPPVGFGLLISPFLDRRRAN